LYQSAAKTHPILDRQQTPSIRWRHEVRIIHMRKHLNGFHPQLWIAMPTVRDMHFARDPAPLK
jgi:hypothetical protein